MIAGTREEEEEEEEAIYYLPVLPSIDPPILALHPTLLPSIHCTNVCTRRKINNNVLGTGPNI